jgi:hypothetical protein
MGSGRLSIPEQECRGANEGRCVDSVPNSWTATSGRRVGVSRRPLRRCAGWGSRRVAGTQRRQRQQYKTGTLGLGRQWEQTMQRTIGGSVSATNNPVRRREGLGAVWLKRRRRLQGSWIGTVTDAADGCNRRRGDGDGYGYAWICMLRSCAHMQEGESKVIRCRTRRDAGVGVRRRARARARAWTRVRACACLRWTTTKMARQTRPPAETVEPRGGEERREETQETEYGDWKEGMLHT